MKIDYYKSNGKKVFLFITGVFYMLFGVLLPLINQIDFSNLTEIIIVVIRSPFKILSIMLLVPYLILLFTKVKFKTWILTAFFAVKTIAYLLKLVDCFTNFMSLYTFNNINNIEVLGYLITLFANSIIFLSSLFLTIGSINNFNFRGLFKAGTIISIINHSGYFIFVFLISAFFLIAHIRFDLSSSTFDLYTNITLFLSSLSSILFNVALLCLVFVKNEKPKYFKATYQQPVQYQPPVQYGQPVQTADQPLEPIAQENPTATTTDNQ